MEYFSVVRATRAIERADVALVVIDADEGFTVEDKKIANIVIEAGRALLLVANKWDLVEVQDDAYADLTRTVRQFLAAPVMRTSAAADEGCTVSRRCCSTCMRVATSKIPTSKVNEVVQQAQRERPTPRRTGTLHYATQVSSGPPSFVIFGGANEPDPSYRRYIENRLRAAFHLEGVPIRVRYRPRRRRS